MSAQPEYHRPARLEPVQHRVIATWPVGTFLENIAVLHDGSFAVSIHDRQEIVRVSRDGSVVPLASLPASPAGQVAMEDGLFVVAGQPGHGPHRLFKIGLDGSVEERLQVPDTVFLNGFTPGRPGRAYTVDSMVGVVIEIDLEAATSRVVLRDDRLGKCSDEPMIPGANGIKLSHRGLVITNTDRALVLLAAMDDDRPNGEIVVLAENLRGDDLALDETGNLYITNHIHNTLTRLAPDGERVAIAGPDQGMAGCTACAFAPDDPTGLYVTTTGGVVMPLDGVMQEAKLVRLETRARGRFVAFGA